MGKRMMMTMDDGPSEIPALMRGEEVKNALYSGSCVCWELTGTALAQGLIRIEGSGTIDFLNNKLTQTFSSGMMDQFKQACLLNAKGQVVDLVSVAVFPSQNVGYILTSPGHSGQELFERLDPLIFPMDRIRLEAENDAYIMTLVSSDQAHVDQAIRTHVLPNLKLPDEGRCVEHKLQSGSLLIVPHAILPNTVGYTLVFRKDEAGLGRSIFAGGAAASNGPVGIGALEYETLRIEAAVPAYGKEFTGNDNNKGKKTPPGPLELQLKSMLDLDKGCYLGQEGVASVLKNKRGPPRTLYQVIFHNPSRTVLLPGQEIFVSGSNEGILVGTLTSVAEPTGDATVALALVRRAHLIQRKIKEEMGLTMENWKGRNDVPLDGLDVVVVSSQTRGVLKSVRRDDSGDEVEMIMPVKPPEMEDHERKQADENPPDVQKMKQDNNNNDEEAAQKKAQQAAAEAERKAAKMEMLKKRAEEAMARRMRKQGQTNKES